MMKLILENIGKIRKATVELGGITVIAGENNTGKSTVGRALFAVFNSFYNSGEQLYEERVQSVKDQLDLLYRRGSGMRIAAIHIRDVAHKLVSEVETQDIKTKIIEMLSPYDTDIGKRLEGPLAKEAITRIQEALSVSDEALTKSVLEKKLGAEFSGQVCNLFSGGEGKICLQIQEQWLTVFLRDSEVVAFQNPGGISLHTDSIYIDDPFVLDELSMPSLRMIFEQPDHRAHLREKLYGHEDVQNLVDEIVIGNRLERIYEKIASVCTGDIEPSKTFGAGYRSGGSDKVLDVKNLSTGLKTFVILKTLLKNGAISYNGTVILDEPEIHLHPEWQLLFAELMVLLHKEFGVHILLNTHSPYFLNAIEVYAAKYEVADRCRYYLSRSQGGSAEIEDVTDSIEVIYQKLARPLQRLENERYAND